MNDPKHDALCDALDLADTNLATARLAEIAALKAYIEARDALAAYKASCKELGQWRVEFCEVNEDPDCEPNYVLRTAQAKTEKEAVRLAHESFFVPSKWRAVRATRL